MLKNGLQLAALPSELTGILTGVLLVSTITIDRPGQPAAIGEEEEEWDVKNTQVAVLCAAILVGSLIVAGTNVWLVRSLDRPAVAPALPSMKRAVIAMMPKAKGDPYFVSCRVGAEAAAAELGVELIWDGPTGLDAARQNELVESWITRGVDVIAVAVENRAQHFDGVAQAGQRGSMSSPGMPTRNRTHGRLRQSGDGRRDRPRPHEEAAKLLGGKGEFAIITGALSAATRTIGFASIKARAAERYPDPSWRRSAPATTTATRRLPRRNHPARVSDVKLVIALSAPAVPVAGEAVLQANRSDVKVIGLSFRT